MNYLLLTGAGIFLGVLGGKVFRKFKIPQVVGYITIGFLLGESGLNLYPPGIVHSFTPLINFTLGVIGFIIGLELKKEVFKKYGRSIYSILISEGILAFLLVCLVVTLLTKELYLGLLLGAIASATDPASTINVLWEYKTRGPLTTTLTSIVALDDGLALILYGLVSMFSKMMITKEHFSLLSSICFPLWEILQCFVLGGLAGIILVKLISSTREKELAIPFILGAVALTVGGAIYFKLDLILCSMVVGATVTNLLPKGEEKIFEGIKELASPFYIFFFVVVGASLNIRTFFQMSVIAIILGYLVARSVGKIIGATFAGIVSGAKQAVIKYTGICLFTQGGVAMGLAMSIAHTLSYVGDKGKVAGDVIVSVVAATTFVVQLIGPVFVKLGVTKAEEVGKNVTEEDIIESYCVEDVMSRDFLAIPENATLSKIIEAIKEKESYHFPVVNKKGELVGLISLGNLRAVLAEEQLNQFILAEDVASGVDNVLYRKQPLKEAIQIFDKGGIDYLPVVEEPGAKKIVGVVEYHPLRELINRKLFEGLAAL